MADRNIRILGIDTSNYTTSAAVVENGAVMQNLKLPLPVKEGERGLRQSDAVFAHIKNLPQIMPEVKAGFDAIAVSAYPRDCEGSYMPCFLAGEAAAVTAASAAGVPLYRFSHQAGHIRAAVYSSGHNELVGSEFLAFHVSGGTTELLYVNGEKIELLGGTLDLNAGQVIDRTGVKLGLKFPCGRELEKLASEGKSPYKPQISVKNFGCNLSGVENKVNEMLAQGISQNDIAAYVFDFIGRTLERLTENALNLHPGLPVLYAGGVMSNKLMRKRLTDKFTAYFAEPEFSSDNACGTALLCYDALTAGGN